MCREDETQRRGLLLEETRREVTPTSWHTRRHTGTHILSSVLDPNLTTYADPLYHASMQHASTMQRRGGEQVQTLYMYVCACVYGEH